MSKKRINSRQKGKRIEREACAYLVSLGFPAARRTAQVRGSNDGAADIECPALSAWHIEVKGDESIQVGSAGWIAAIAQARRDLCPTNDPTVMNVNVWNSRKWGVLWRRKALPWCLTFPHADGSIVTVTGEVDIRAALEGFNKGTTQGA